TQSEMRARLDALQRGAFPPRSRPTATTASPRFDRPAALRLLDGLRTPRIVVSFPTRSLGGRAKGMGENYSVRFRQLTAARPWTVRELAAPGELVFLVEKPM
ncbi:hypothetical protein K6Y57_37095, partial [Burkholderia cenocepacia]|nr:hypothetical protein [Burkholderia cenocepacia]